MVTLKKKKHFLMTVYQLKYISWELVLLRQNKYQLNFFNHLKIFNIIIDLALSQGTEQR